MKISILLQLVIVVILSQTVMAVPYIDHDIQSWSEQVKRSTTSGGPTEKLRALIILKANKSEFFSVLNQKRSLNKKIKLLNNELGFLLDGRIVESLWSIQSLIVDLDLPEFSKLAQAKQVVAIYNARKKMKLSKNLSENEIFEPLLTDYTYGLKNIKVPDLKKWRPEIDGTGIKVGILDTGLYATHPDIAGRMLMFKNFSPSSDNSVRDPFGHGTHVAGTIAAGSRSGTTIGIAPQSELIIGRIFDGNGESTKELILKAMQWMLDPDENPETTSDRPRVVNNSWGDNDPYNDRDPQEDPFCLMIDSWVAAGIVPVFTAGNTGPKPRSINVPGACPGSLTVGATEQYDRSPHFSSEGPTSWKTVEIIKPDVVAPGVDIRSLGNFGNEYEMMTGTSMAAPHVTGALALLFQAKPDLTSVQAISIMRATAKDLGPVGKDNTFGDGRIDILKAVQSLQE